MRLRGGGQLLHYTLVLLNLPGHQLRIERGRSKPFSRYVPDQSDKWRHTVNSGGACNACLGMGDLGRIVDT